MSAVKELHANQPTIELRQVVNPLDCATQQSAADHQNARIFRKEEAQRALGELGQICRKLEMNEDFISSLSCDQIVDQACDIYNHICKLAIQAILRGDSQEATVSKVKTTVDIVHQFATKIAFGEGISRVIELRKLHNLAAGILPIINENILDARDGGVVDTQKSIDILMERVAGFADDLLLAHYTWLELRSEYGAAAQNLKANLLGSNFGSRTVAGLTHTERQELENRVWTGTYELAESCRRLGAELIDRLKTTFFGLYSPLVREAVTTGETVSYQGKTFERDRFSSDIERDRNNQLDAFRRGLQLSAGHREGAHGRNEALRCALFSFQRDLGSPGMAAFNTEKDPGLYFVNSLIELFQILAPYATNRQVGDLACRKLCGNEVSEELRRLAMYKLDGIVN